MKSRRTLSALVAVASLALLATACGGSDDNAGGSAKSDNGDKTEATTDGGSEGSGSEGSGSEGSGSEGSGSEGSADATTDTLSNSEFNTEVDKIIDKFKKAGTDPCAVSAAQEFEPPEPTNSTQTMKVVEVYALLLRSMAGSLPESSAEAGAGLNRAADAIEKAAKDADLSRDFFSSEGLLQIISGDEMTNGITAFANATKGCEGSAAISPGASAEG